MNHLLATALAGVPGVMSLLLLLLFLARFPHQFEGRDKLFCAVLEQHDRRTFGGNWGTASGALACLDEALRQEHFDCCGTPLWTTVKLAARELCRIANEPELTLRYNSNVCAQCGAESLAELRRYRATCFTKDDGPLVALILVHGCSACGAHHHPSFWCDPGKPGQRMYYSPTSTYFMASTSTAFEVSLLVQSELHIARNHASFQGLESVYNESCDAVPELCRKRLTEAYFRYILCLHLEANGVLASTSQGTSGELDKDLLRFQDDYVTSFSTRWGKYHHCNTPGCRLLVAGTDGHMKARRSLCANNGIRVAVPVPAVQDGTVLRGCTRAPCPRSRFCQECIDAGASGLGDELPIKAIKGYSSQSGNPTYQVVRARGTTASAESWVLAADLDAALIIEYHTKKHTVLPTAVASLDHVRSYMTTHALDPNQPPVPSSSIRGGGGSLSMDPADVGSLKCNTEKDKENVAVNATSAGVMAVCWACGIIIGVNELYGAESLSQVYAHLVTLWALLEYAPPFFFYDDGCHLARFMLNPIRFNDGRCNFWQRMFSMSRVFIDRTHFRNHTDGWCQQHMNPDDVPECEGVNTQVCEQLFSWLSGYKHIVRHMNEARFLFFICRLCHVHNVLLERKMARKGLLVQAASDASVLFPPATQWMGALPGSPLFWLAKSNPQVAKPLSRTGAAGASTSSVTARTTTTTRTKAAPDEMSFERADMLVVEAWTQAKASGRPLAQFPSLTLGVMKTFLRKRLAVSNEVTNKREKLVCAVEGLLTRCSGIPPERVA